MNKTDIELTKLEAMYHLKAALAMKGIDYDTASKYNSVKDRLESYKKIKKKSIKKRLNIVSKEYE